jgi:hypothetical protein
MVIGLMAALFVVAGASACGDDGEDGNGGSSGDGFDVDLSDDVPDDYPIDAVPLPGGDLTSAATIGGSGGRSWTLTYSTADPTAAAARYRGDLAGSGFTIGETLTDDAGELESFVATGAGYVVNAFAGEVRGGAGSSVLSVTVAEL